MKKKAKGINLNKERAEDVISYLKKHGKEKTKKDFGFSDDTIERYLRAVKQNGWDDLDSSKTKSIAKILDQYTDAELRTIANGRGGHVMQPRMCSVPEISFEGQRVRVGTLTDTHIGSVYFDKKRLFQAFDEFRKEKVDFITHSGDVTEGMSHRPGHIYELNQIGYNAQKKEAIDLFGQWTDTPIYAIDGNHDRWFIKSNGALMVSDIDDSLKNFHFIGHDEGSISLKNKAILTLWHGEDGASYATSYRIQKIVEALSGGSKPSAMIFGHDHKYINMFERFIYCTGAGCIESQSKWMRGKRISAHTGFCINDYWVNKSGICKMSHTWYPFYI
jgi:predicted phosphodiesterase/transposase